MTPTPHLHALAMRTKAAEAAKARADYWRETSETAKSNKNPKEARDWQSMMLAGLFVRDAILALPLEADHKALLDEAVRLPEIAALIEAVNLLGLRKLVAGWSGETVGASYEPHPPRLGVTLKTNCGTVYKIDAALKALETP